MVLWLYKNLWTKITRLSILLEALEVSTKLFRTVMLGKSQYPTFTQFVNALKGFKMREDTDDQVENIRLDSNMSFVVQKCQKRGCGYYNRGRGQQQQRGRGFGRNSSQHQSGGSSNMDIQPKETIRIDPCQICDRNNHTTPSCFYR